MVQGEKKNEKQILPDLPLSLTVDICKLPLIQLCINYQLDAQIIIYSYNITFLYMFRAINAHLQDVTLYTCSI
jgi:hypothetical protein